MAVPSGRMARLGKAPGPPTFVDRGHTPNSHASGNARYLLHRCMGPVPDDLEASELAGTVPAGQNAVTTWLGTAAPGLLFVAPQLVPRAATTLAGTPASAVPTRQNRPSGAVATTSMLQLLRWNTQAVGQWIRLVVNRLHDLQHVVTCHDSLLAGKSGPARRLPPVHSSRKWTGTLPRVVSGRCLRHFGLSLDLLDAGRSKDEVSRFLCLSAGNDQRLRVRLEKFQPAVDIGG